MTSLSPDEQAKHFIQNETAFHLGALPTENPHPKTVHLSQIIAKDTAAGIKNLLEVDRDIPDAIEKVIRGPAFQKLVDAISEAALSKRRIFFSGCGATGRLAILFEAAWRRFWQGMRVSYPHLTEQMETLEEALVSVMAGGDHALIRSTEGFEDSTNLGKYQLTLAGVRTDDVVVAVTEGGETSFVIGTAWKGVEVGAKVFFVYNNPTEVLRKQVQRSREIIDSPEVTSLDLFTGNMAVAGSTRMQATTAELLTLAAALDTVIWRIVQERFPETVSDTLRCDRCEAAEYPARFAELLEDLHRPENLHNLARLIEWEEAIYHDKARVTYMTDRFLLDVLTDTTERAPTFRLPPFRKCDDRVAVPSWAFVKNPNFSTPEAWWQILRRSPRGIDWPQSVYRDCEVPPPLCDNPPKLSTEEIHKFTVGNELDASRFEMPGSALAMILVGREAVSLSEDSPFYQTFQAYAAHFAKTATVVVGPTESDHSVGETFHIECQLPGSPLELWNRLAIKLVLNLMSTATMARLGRVEGNLMARVETTNKKLIDRGTRLVMRLAQVDYPTACTYLHRAMHSVAQREQTTRDAPSPVAIAVEQLKARR